MNTRLRNVSMVMLLSLMVALAACGGDETSSATTGTAGEEVNIAFFSVVRNSYATAQLEGIEEAAKAAGNADVTVFEAGFDPQKQFNQCEDAISSGSYNAFILAPVAGPTVMPCVEDAVDAGIAVAVHGTPLGTDFETADPPVPGMAGNVLVPAAPDGVNNAKLIVEACEPFDSCQVAYIYGARAVGWDLARFNALKGYLDEYPNIHIVGTGEGAFVPDTALKAATDLLTAHPDLNVLASCCDQGALGWERAMANANAADKIIIGGGAGCTSIERIKDDKWLGTTVLLPRSGAKLAAEIVINTVRGLPVEDGGVNEATLSQTGQVITRENAGDFQCEWSG